MTHPSLEQNKIKRVLVGENECSQIIPPKIKCECSAQLMFLFSIFYPPVIVYSVNKQSGASILLIIGQTNYYSFFTPDCWFEKNVKFFCIVNSSLTVVRILYIIGEKKEVEKHYFQTFDIFSCVSTNYCK